MKGKIRRVVRGVVKGVPCTGVSDSTKKQEDVHYSPSGYCQYGLMRLHVKWFNVVARIMVCQDYTVEVLYTVM